MHDWREPLVGQRGLAGSSQQQQLECSSHKMAGRPDQDFTGATNSVGLATTRRRQSPQADRWLGADQGIFMVQPLSTVFNSTNSRSVI